MKPDADLCPRHIVDAFNRYVNRGQMPGGFLTAVLENNLVEAFHRADSNNLEALPHIVSYMYNRLPGSCWGSPETVQAYLVRFRYVTKV